jgi:DNA (cytosine-5)-methyltransferase 1
VSTQRYFPEVSGGALRARGGGVRLLDLFCGAGGASVGYHRAGFEVVGVDVRPMPRYPFEFHRGGALEFVRMRGREFDAIHASPPCQAYSRNMRHLAAPQPMLIEQLRELLKRVGVPWVIENVEGAPLPAQDDLFGGFGTVLCGTAFGLRVWRHRWFECSFPVFRPPCRHGTGWAMNPHNAAGRKRIYREFGRQGPELLWKREMGVEWMNHHEAREAVPPAYTRFVGEQLMWHLETAT